MDTNIGIQATTECMKEINQIGHTIWVNICTNTKVDVPWGVMDWLVMGVILPFIGLLIIYAIYLLIKELRG